MKEAVKEYERSKEKKAKEVSDMYLLYALPTTVVLACVLLVS